MISKFKDFKKVAWHCAMRHKPPVNPNGWAWHVIYGEIQGQDAWGIIQKNLTFKSVVKYKWYLFREWLWELRGYIDAAFSAARAYRS